MLLRIAVGVIILLAIDAYFFHGRYFAIVLDEVENFGTNLNDAISRFTRRLQ